MGMKNAPGFFSTTFGCDGVNPGYGTKQSTFRDQSHPKPQNLIFGKDRN
jgi:hypothetical protein